MSDSLLCTPFDPWVGRYILIHLILAVFAMDYCEKMGNQTKLSHFLATYLPIVAFIYLSFSKVKAYEKVNSWHIYINIVLCLVYAARRIC